MRSMSILNYLQHRIELARAELHKITEERDNLLHPEVLEHSEQLDAWLNHTIRNSG
ncbi:Spo0E like sporulation regulatory protein [compost metagenome]